MSDAILVTGGAGYVGSHACKALAGAGYRPIVYDNLSRGHREAVRWGPLIEGDLNDTDQVAAALQTHRVTAVMHFAAYAYVGESVGEPATYYRNNVGGTLALLEAMRRAGTGTIVFSSTRGLWQPRAPADRRGDPEAAAQPLWRDKARRRTGIALVCRRLWAPFRGLALF